MPSDEARELVLEMARLLDEQKAEDVVVFDVAGLTSVADYFVVSTARNARHMKALSRHITELAGSRGKRILGEEGAPESGWILIDAADIIVHIFDQDKRRLYNLELLWGDAGELKTENDAENKK